MDAGRAIKYQVGMTGVCMLLAQEAEAAAPLIQDSAEVFAVLLGVLAVIFWFGEHRAGRALYRVVPALVFCYFVPTLLTTLGVLPDDSALYSWIKSSVLPAAILLLILSLDLPAVIRLGPKAMIMLLAGTAGVVIGGPIALLLCNWGLPESLALPDDAWKGMTALAGSWIGGGANFVALGQIAGADDTQMATMVIPDVFVASIWMGVLLFLAGHQRRIDAWTGADASAIRELEQRLTEFQKRVNRVPRLVDVMMILAIGFLGSAACAKLAGVLPRIGDGITATTWKYILVTTLGIALSFTRARNLEGAGASRLGSVMIYLLVACIGASADFRRIFEQPGYLIAGFVWIGVHIVIMLAVARIIRAPVFFMAVASQANIGGAASAPVVAAAYHPSLAPVGVLLAVVGYVLGTYAGLVCMYLLKMASGL